MPSEIIQNHDRPEQGPVTSGVSLPQSASFLRTAILALLAQACASNAVPVRGPQAETRPAGPVQVNVSHEPTKAVSAEETRDQAREREVQRLRDAESTCYYPAPGAQRQVEAWRIGVCLDNVRNSFLRCMAQGNTLPSLIPTEPAEWERRCHENSATQRAQCNPPVNQP